MPYFSEFYQVEVRDDIVAEFTNALGEVDDMLAGLHEIRMRKAEKQFDLKKLAEDAARRSVGRRTQPPKHP